MKCFYMDKCISTQVLCLYNYGGFGGVGEIFLSNKQELVSFVGTGMGELRDILCYLRDDGQPCLGSQEN